MCQWCGFPRSVIAIAIGDAYRVRIRSTPDEAPDALVTIVQAQRIFPDARADTLAVWAHRAAHADHTQHARSPLTMRGRNAAGKPLFRLGDIADALRSNLVEVAARDTGTRSHPW